MNSAAQKIKANKDEISLRCLGTTYFLQENLICDSGSVGLSVAVVIISHDARQTGRREVGQLAKNYWPAVITAFELTSGVTPQEKVPTGR